MKFLLKAEVEIDIDDKWLQEIWQEDPVEDEEADALKCAIDTFKDALLPSQIDKLFNPIEIHVLDVTQFRD